MYYSSTSTKIARNLLTNCKNVLDTTLLDATCVDALNAISDNIVSLEIFVRGYENINDPLIDSDDEILNWVFSESISDLFSATWLLASGFYKASASSLRNAFDISMAALYFQVRENTNPEIRSYNLFFAEWDSGVRDTPNWGEMKGFILNQPSVRSFNSLYGINIVDRVYDHFKYLCSYTHNRSYDGNGDPVTTINTTGSAPAFDLQYFNRGVDLTKKTISLIAILWQVVFPGILITKPLGSYEGGGYDDLFLPPYGPYALSYGMNLE